MQMYVLVLSDDYHGFFFQSLIHFDFIKYILLYIICSIFVVVLLNIMLSSGKDNVMFGAEKR